MTCCHSTTSKDYKDTAKAVAAASLKLGIRLTPTRLKVMEIISQFAKPVTAYEILDKLKKFHKNPAPPTVYRALEFLLEHRFIHKINSTNQYVACAHLGHGELAQFLICTNCGQVQELHSAQLEQEIKKTVGKIGFTCDSFPVEILGLCKACQ